MEDLSHGTVIVDASVVAHPLLNAAAEVAAGRVPRRSGCSGVASTACGYVKLKWPRDVALRFAEDWVPIPTPFAVLLDHWIASRPNLQTAAHESSPWLFPGLMPGEHLQASGVQALLAKHGIPPRAARTAAWRELVRSVPPPLLASAFGVNAHTVDEYGRQAGSRYARYAGLGRTR